MTRIAIFRLAAVFLLLWTGVELFACEMISPNCESFGSPEPGSTGSADDNCLCCCTHAVIVSAVVIHPLAERVTDVDTSQAAKPEYKAFSIYHPPRV